METSAKENLNCDVFYFPIFALINMLFILLFGFNAQTCQMLIVFHRPE